MVLSSLKHKRAWSYQNRIQIGHLLEAILSSAIFSLFKTHLHLSVVIVQNFDAMALVFVSSLITLVLVLGVFDSRLEFLLLVVKFIFKRQKVLIKRDAVAKQRLVSTCLVLLVDFLIFEQLDLRFHRCDLLVQIHDDVFMDKGLFSALIALRSCSFYFVCSCRKFRMTFKLLVDDWSCGSRVNIEVCSSESHITGG